MAVIGAEAHEAAVCEAKVSRTLVGLSLNRELVAVRTRSEGNEGLDGLQGHGIRRIDLNDHHRSAELGDHIEVQVDVESGSLRTRGGGNREGGDLGLSREGARADRQVLANLDKVGVFISSNA